MDRRAPTAPPVVAVMVAHDPGAWFDDALAALAGQDYPNLSVLVLDTGTGPALDERVRAVLPDAALRRVGSNPGYGATLNMARELVQGAAFFCFLHDDVAPDSSCLRLLVEEAYRSNAAIIGPKLVAWDDPRRLLEVGDAVDKGGVLAPYAERGELDQEQHDAVRDVFSVPGACMVVRADLFGALGGFDPEITFHGEDLDLCWRAHVAGARVMVNPSARARHREAMTERRPDDRRRLLARHRLRTALTCYGPVHLLRVVPQLVILTMAEVLYSLVVGRTRQARDVMGAWPWNLRRMGQVRRNRRRLNAVRQVPDNEVRGLQVRGSARVSAFVRGQIGHDDDRRSAAAAATRNMVGSLRASSRQVVALAAVALVALAVVGSRHLITQGVPVVGELAAFPSSPFTLLRDYLTGWHQPGVGTTAPAPSATALVGVAGVVGLGFMDLVRTLAVLLPLAIGWLGAYRLTGPLLTARARAAGLVLYAACPLPYNALANGHWGALTVYAATPWVLARLARASRLAPFGPVGGDPAPGLVRRSLPAQVVALGLLIAVVLAFVPLFPVLVVLSAVALVLGSVLAGGTRASLRAVVVAVGGTAVALVLHLPWSAELLSPDGAWSAIGAVRSADGGGGGHSLAELLRFHTGPVGAGPIGWFLVVVAALPLLVGRSWRLAWATRAWAIALASVALAWGAERGWFDRSLGDPEVLLVPAAAALALAGALGMSAFEADLRGFRFGWRQVASMGALVVAALGVLPVLGAAVDGRWGLPRGDFTSTLGFLDGEQDEGGYRVLWLGDPRALPMDGWWLRDGLAYALSEDGLPDVRGQWVGTPSDPTAMVPAALNVAGDDLTERLGRLLAPAGIKYVVVPLSDAPGIFDRTRYEVDPSLTTMLASQLDLERVNVDDAVVVYRNASWAPTRVLLDAEGAEASQQAGFDGAAAADLTGGTPALLAHPRATLAEGEVPGGAELYAATPSSGRWRLEVDGEAVGGHTAFGWANAWTVAGGGEARLTYRTPPIRWVLVAVQAVLWLLALQLVLRALAAGYEGDGAGGPRRRGRGRHAAGGDDTPDLLEHPPGPLLVAAPVVVEHAVDDDLPLELPWSDAPEEVPVGFGPDAGHRPEDVEPVEDEHPYLEHELHTPVVDREAPTWDDDVPVWDDEVPVHADEEDDPESAASFAEAWAATEDDEAADGEPAWVGGDEAEDVALRWHDDPGAPEER